jgi:SAM-dependent methyltransferase
MHIGTTFSFFSPVPPAHHPLPGHGSRPTSLLERAKGKLLRAVRAHRRYLGRAFRPNIWTIEPVSRDFGFDRGQPVDRFYIERFLAREAAAIRGAVLEVTHDIYTRRFGGDRVTRSDVLHREAGLPRATIVADLADAPELEADRFDCIILTHTLQYIFDAPAALRTCRRILKPGGTLLIAVPFIGQYSPADREQWGEYWRFSRMALGRMLAEAFGADHVRVEAYGNALSATAFLHGIAAEELSAHELDVYDPDYDLIVAGVARKQD